jgi:Glycosyl transferases group 1
VLGPSSRFREAPVSSLGMDASCSSARDWIFFVDAWDWICRLCADEDLCLLLIGAGKDTREVQKLDATGLRGNDLRRYLSTADVCVLPSRHEGVPWKRWRAVAAPGVPDICGGHWRQRLETCWMTRADGSSSDRVHSFEPSPIFQLIPAAEIFARS